MKTKAILVAAAAAFLLASGPAFADNSQSGEAKRCYRTLHKVPFPIRVPCPKPKVPAPSGPTQPDQTQKPTTQQPS